MDDNQKPLSGQGVSIDFDALFTKILTCSPYNTWKKSGKDKSGNIAYRPAGKNPKEQLSKIGLKVFDGMTKVKPLTDIAKELHINLKEFITDTVSQTKSVTPASINKTLPFPDDQKDRIVLYIMNKATLTHTDIELIQKHFLIERGTPLTPKQIKNLGFKVSRYIKDDRMDTMIITPYHMPSGKVIDVKINRIFVDPETGEKIKKMQLGSYDKDSGFFYGKKTAKKLKIFEGLEKALAYFVQEYPKNKDFAILATYGTAGFQHIDKFISKFDEVELYLDADESSETISNRYASMRASLYLGDKVKRVVPGLKIDADKALKDGNFDEWLKSIRPVSILECKMAQLVAECYHNTPDIEACTSSAVEVLNNILTFQKQLFLNSCAPYLLCFLAENNKEAFDSILKKAKGAGILIGDSRKKIEEVKKELKKAEKESEKKDALSANGNNSIFWEYDRKGNLSMEYNLFFEFLEENGFFRICHGEGSERQYRYIHLKDNVVELVDRPMIKNFVYDFLKGNREIRNFIIKGSDTYFSAGKFDGLNILELNLFRDTKEKAYFYFKNGIVEVTKNNTRLIPYSEADGYHVWKSSIIDKNVDLSKVGQSDFEICLENTSKHLDYEDGKEIRVLDSDNHLRKMLAFGYLLHTYKDPSITKAVVCVDRNLDPDSQQSNGRTGKGIFFKGINQLRNSILLPGKTHDNKDKFILQSVKIDHNVVSIDDVPRKFDFESLFNWISEDFAVQAKGSHNPQIIIPFKDAPKILITSNFPMTGDGSSFEDRQTVVEFSNYYTPQFKPVDEFGIPFFSDDWTDDQWQRFFNFGFKCTKLYLEKRLPRNMPESYEKNKMVANVRPELVDFLDYYFSDNTLGYYDQVQLRDINTFWSHFTEIEPDFESYKPKKLNALLKEYAKFKGYKDPEKTRSNSKTIFFFEKSDFTSAKKQRGKYTKAEWDKYDEPRITAVSQFMDGLKAY